jgi:hypothetical protein
MTSLSLFIAPLQELLNYFQRDRLHSTDGQQKAEENRKGALDAIYAALVTTSKYLEDQPDGMDRAKQLELSQLWAQAAIKSRTYFSTDDRKWMAEKADYYLTKMKWPNSHVTAKRIDLVTVQERVKELIAE